jgi:RNA polymerase sigma-70 factor (ECF subfamily)
VKAFITADEEVLRQAMSEHGPSILSFISRSIPESATAEDLYQETWIRAYHSRHTYDPERPLRTWLYSIALNAVRTHVRRRRRQTEAETQSARPETPATQRDVASTDVRMLLDRLPEEQREVFLLREFQGLSYDQIALVTQRPVGTLKSQMFHAVQKLKRIVEPLWTAPK